jgi:DNA-binding LacI/PurR family transcriptional regulator
MKKRGEGRATIKTIAEKAGVATSTVSRALTDKPDVDPDTKERILAIAKEIGYTPSALARSLVTRRSYTIGLALYSLADIWVVNLGPKLDEVFREAGYEVFLSTHYLDTEIEHTVCNNFRGRQVDGIIVVNSMLSREYPRLMAEWGIPVVLIGPMHKSEHRYIVAVDERAGSAKAVDYLIELGHRRIGFINFVAGYNPGRLRLEGYQQALQEHRIPFDPSLVTSSEETSCEEDGFRMATQLLSQPDPPTAIYCFNDRAAIGVCHAAARLGLRIPQDLSVVGFDDITIARYLQPPLTTIRPRTDDLGAKAAHMLLDLIAGRDAETPIVIGTELVERESTRRLE